MDDVRWFAPNRYCTLIVPRLRDRGLSIALEGDRPARLAIAMDAQLAAAAYSFAARHRSVLIHYVWDLDRKSTRLNSSHLVISYAVFCLKKKNKTRQAVL